MSYYDTIGDQLKTIAKVVFVVVAFLALLMAIWAGALCINQRESKCELCGVRETRIRIVTNRMSKLRLCGECGQKVVDMMRQGEDEQQ